MRSEVKGRVQEYSVESDVLNWHPPGEDSTNSGHI